MATVKIRNKAEADRLFQEGKQQYQTSQFEAALESWQQALAIYREIEDRQGIAASLNNLGIVYDSLGQYEPAIDYHQQSLQIQQEIGDRSGIANSLNNLGWTFFKSGSLTEAETHFQQGIEVYESLRVKLEDAHKISIFETQSNVYLGLQQVLIAQNKINNALEIAERGRARALVDLLKQNVSTPSDSPLPLEYPSLQEIQQIAQQQNATLVEYSIVSNKQLYIYVIQPSGKLEFRSVDLPQDISLEDLVTNGYFCIIQDECRGDVANPAIGDFVKLNDDQFDQPWQVVDIQQDNLIIRQENWEEGMTIARPVTDVVAIVNAYNRERLQKLHQLLIQPIAHLLPTEETDRIIFIPHQELFFVPFTALQDQAGKYLIEKHTILTAPSIEVLSLTHQQRQKLSDAVQGALVVGNPTMPKVKTQAGQEPQQLSNLPHAETEAIKIAELLDTQPLTGENATKAAILPRLSQARMIHFATHGLLDDFKGLGVPGAIALGPDGTGKDNDGLLTAGELLEMKLNAELVVLSACKTGQGNITSDGVIGLSRSLVAAGVPSIVVSLWSVSDAPTADLMAKFYQNLDKTDDKAQALRQAMLATMEQHPNPKNWAAFTLIGEAF